MDPIRWEGGQANLCAHVGNAPLHQSGLAGIIAVSLMLTMVRRQYTTGAGWGMTTLRAVVIGISFLQPVGLALGPISIVAAWKAALTGAKHFPAWLSAAPSIVGLILVSGFAVMVLCQIRMRRHGKVPAEKAVLWRALLAAAYPVMLPIYSIKYFR